MKGGLVIVKLVRKMLSKFLSSLIRYDHLDNDIDDTEEGDEEINTLPEDVKEGHFAVHTVDDHGELRRFILELNYLSDPGFLKLLDQAEQEFGFEQMGILVIPCTYSDLQSITQSKGKHSIGLERWALTARVDRLLGQVNENIKVNHACLEV